MRQTTVLEWRKQVRHGLHLFFVIAASVVSRNVATQEVLEALGPEALGRLYVAVAIVAGLTAAALGWLGRGYDTRKVARSVHLAAALLTALCFVTPSKVPAFAVTKYILMEMTFAATLLVFGLALGASIGPREARKSAAHVGAGGVLGGLLAGGTLSAGALLIGSRALYLVAAGLVLLPVFWLVPTPGWRNRSETLRLQHDREVSEVPALAPYGRSVALTTLLMVAATTLIDYQYRFFAARHFDADELTAFFGSVVIMSGIVTVVFQFTVLDRLLHKLGLFATATIMPSALILCLGMFGMAPAIATLAVLKVIDSGANMSLQQATGSLLLAPLGAGARSVWQGRIDGLAKRGGQVLTGIFLAVFPWNPGRVLPISLVLCAAWLGGILITRSRYVRLLTEMLGAPRPEAADLEVQDTASIRLLEGELAKATADRASVILDLLERARHRAPEPLLKRLVEAEPDGPGALRVIEHLAVVGDARGLLLLAGSPHRATAAAALLAVAQIDLRLAGQRSRELLRAPGVCEPLAATAAALLAPRDAAALRACDELSRASHRETRLAVSRALGLIDPGAAPETDAILSRLAGDRDFEVARTALASLSQHASNEACEVAIKALHRRELRGAAMRALAAMGSPVVPRVCEELSKSHRTPPVAAALAWILGSISAGAGVPALVEALRAPILSVRLSAAAALSTIHRRRSEIPMPEEQLAGCWLPEIDYFRRMREASLGPLPDTPAGRLLLRALKQHAQASLETLFRMLSLRYPEDAMQGAFQAISSNDMRQRQIALELLDTMLEAEVHQAVGAALGGSRFREREPRAGDELLRRLATGADSFLASLARTVIIDEGGGSATAIAVAARTGESMAQKMVDQILELQTLALFSHCSAEDLAEVAALTATRQVAKGTVLFREGEVGDALYLVRSGQVELTKQSKPVDQVGPGEAFGIIAILDGLPRELSATATSDCTLLAIKGDDLVQLLADRPLLMHSVFRALTAALRSQLDRRLLGKRSEDWDW